MRIKICGLFRDIDIDYCNEARPDYAGFVFAQSKRQVSPKDADRLRQRLDSCIHPVGVFVNAPLNEVAALYRNGIISIAQLHGDENESYIARLKKECDGIKVIKGIKLQSPIPSPQSLVPYSKADFILLDSGAGSGKPFDWDVLKSLKIQKPWFLAGGINLDNIEQAIKQKPFGIDVSSGAETNGLKDYEKILQLTAIVKRNDI